LFRKGFSLRIRSRWCRDWLQGGHAAVHHNYFIKEANPPDVSGTATGVVNFLNFTFSALLSRVFGRLHRQLAQETSKMGLANYQTAFAPILNVTVAIALTMFLKETGSAVRS
jgi:hypothetical protein